MSKKRKSEQYGKPYTKKDFKQAGVGLLVVGVLAMIYGISVYQFGAEEHMAQTKVGNQIYDPTPPQSLLHLLIAIGGGVTSLGGVFMWRRGVNKNKAN